MPQACCGSACRPAPPLLKGAWVHTARHRERPTSRLSRGRCRDAGVVVDLKKVKVKVYHRWMMSAGEAV